MKDWDAYNAAAREQGKALNGLHPELVKGFLALNRGAATTQHLDAKTRQLIALAVAITTRCDGCIDAHVRKAKVAGASREEMAEALGVAIALNAGAAFTYALHVLDAAGGVRTPRKAASRLCGAR
ncbi:carboxymuconolactone decarboxylase family protein [Siccirubricoccus deserti]